MVTNILAGLHEPDPVIQELSKERTGDAQGDSIGYSPRREHAPAMGGHGCCRRLLVVRAGHAHGDVMSD